ncbi:MAG: 23S rRNA (pseudouridine(1915)-N(3))-methyltransferase RlmH [Succinatimonas sp.]|nr:23S rRNA (pseudouridine(1915)-N(3))-methyltransferase RlmH [Succinatimonas sp.]
MKIIIKAVGIKMPKWVTVAFEEYQKRFPPEIKLLLEEIAPYKRTGRHDDEKAKQEEALAILQSLPKKCYLVALDERGKQFTSEELALRFQVWQNVGMDIVLIIGGPNGLTDEIRNKASELWSLSKLTLPHPLVRVFLAETIYRAYSISYNLPYHRQ